MEKMKPPVRVVPASAVMHFALTQTSYAAVMAATKYFCEKLQDPKKREQALRAYQELSTIIGFSLPSETDMSDVEPSVDATTTTTSSANAETSRGVKKGLAALREGKK